MALAKRSVIAVVIPGDLGQILDVTRTRPQTPVFPLDDRLWEIGVGSAVPALNLGKDVIALNYQGTSGHPLAHDTYRPGNSAEENRDPLYRIRAIL